MARAIHSLSNSSAYPFLPLFPPFISPPHSLRRLATGSPILSGFVSTPVSECLSSNPFTRPGLRPDIQLPPATSTLPPSRKVKSYGSVKAILSVLAFHVTPAGVFLRLFPAAGVCKGLKYFNQSSWNMAVSTVSSLVTGPYRIPFPSSSTTATHKLSSFCGARGSLQKWANRRNSYRLFPARSQEAIYLSNRWEIGIKNEYRIKDSIR